MSDRVYVFAELIMQRIRREQTCVLACKCRPILVTICANNNRQVIG